MDDVMQGIPNNVDTVIEGLRMDMSVARRGGMKD